MSPVVWLLVAAGLCVGEVLTLDLTLLMLSGAALAAGGTAVVTDELIPQLVAFALAALVLLALVRPLAQRRIRVAGLPAGRDRLAGRTAVVVQAVTDDSGQVRLDGELWRARPYAGGPPATAGSRVVVAAVEGVTLHVYPESLPAGPSLEGEAP